MAAMSIVDCYVECLYCVSEIKMAAIIIVDCFLKYLSCVLEIEISAMRLLRYRYSLCFRDRNGSNNYCRLFFYKYIFCVLEIEMAGTVLPRGDPHSMPQLPVEDERELLNKGTQVNKQTREL
jgi:hypothetical protein